jgi:ABC-2 type transport system permease protein
VIAQTRAEFLKIRTTRTTLGLALGMATLVLLIVVLAGLLDERRSLTEAGTQRDLFSVAGFSSVFAALAGVLLVTSEYRFGTIRPTFLFTPRRSRVIAAKVVASFVAGLALAATAFALSLGVGSTILASRGISISGDEVARLIGGGILSAAFWGAIGAALGSIVRNQVGAVIGLLAWVLIAENVLFGLVPSVGRYTPAQAERALTGADAEHLVPAAAGAALLLTWAVGLTVAGAALTARRDVD